MKDPLYRYFEREVNLAERLVTDIRRDLSDVLLIYQGTKKQTNYHRNLLTDLNRGIIPNSWRRYAFPPNFPVAPFVADLALRARQMEKLGHTGAEGGANALRTVSVWLGGLFKPEAYLTATRQSVAQANSTWSLEELVLAMDVVEGAADSNGAFSVKGLKIQGAQWKDGALHLSSDIMTDIPQANFKWIRPPPGEPRPTSHAGKHLITLPVYLNSTRRELLFTVDLPIKTAPGGDGRAEAVRFYERGVALIASTALT
ncbi:unnamed protein product [Cyprideis torosa]|uniref:Uncharacterized protein n=1 Tax=Cyprideis torosa TaxID=163714 RepID=A0A7R8WJY3_9CRUS|nr:unnamed protein product [Cyprideis torosa]CAG0895478.1 unnamed protein product [Cyprideis torosa]